MKAGCGSRSRPPSHPYGHSAGLRRLVGETTELTEEEAASFEALWTEYETLEA
jgi:ParB family chromosome partitioning protein